MSNIEVQKVASTEDRSLPLFAEFDDLMDRIRVRAYDLFRSRGSAEGQELSDWLTAEREHCWPAAELDEDDDEFKLKVALAGFEPKDISVTATPKEVIVKASYRSKKEGGDEPKVRWSEFRSNDVYRRIELPKDIKVDKIKAKLKNGLLMIHAPKLPAEASSHKEIEVSTGD